MFDHAVFEQGAFQLRAFADGYAALNLDAESAAAWANRGFMPDEIPRWRNEGHTPARASYWANKYTVSPAEARKRDDEQ